MRFFFMSKLYFFMFVGLIESVAELDKLKYWKEFNLKSIAKIIRRIFFEIFDVVMNFSLLSKMLW